MENVAHALAGLMLAKGAVMLRERSSGSAQSARFVGYASWVSALANNVPDSDLLITPLTGGKLGYLLHHRGHTHTLLVGVVLGLLLAGCANWIWRRRHGDGPSVSQARWLLGLGALGPVVHMAMDGLNVYGVHPFWPFDNRWFYGDAVFIVEPMLWLAAVPFLWAEARSRIGRGVLLLIAGLGLGLPWLASAFVPLSARLFLLGFALLAALVARLSPARIRAFAGLLTFVSVPILFLATSAMAKTAMAARFAADFPAERLSEIAASGYPSNPWCWSAIAISTDAGELVLRRATFSLSPGLLPVGGCPARDGTTTAQLTAVNAPNDRQLRWEGEVRLSLQKLRAENESRCDVAAAMRFYRAPFLVFRAKALVLGDLRFDRDEGIDFAELELPLEVAQCPAWVPGWQPPREAELHPAD